MRGRLSASGRLLLASGLILGAANIGLVLTALLAYASLGAPRAGRPAVTPASATATAETEPAPTEAPRTARNRRPSPTADVGRRVVTLTPAAGQPTAPAASVDWPVTPDVDELEELSRSEHFRVYAEDDDDAFLVRVAGEWDQTLEPRLASVQARLGGRALPGGPVAVVFARTYAGRCPARGLAAAQADPPLLMAFVDEDTPALQIRAVLAHELAHHLTIDDAYVGDGVLTEGLANWAGGAPVLRWQGLASWPEAVRRYWRQGRYVSVADDQALAPQGDEPCLDRRDRVYNIRTAFVSWLIDEIGLASVLSMPALELRGQDGPGAQAPRVVPDYERATGRSLRELEGDFLLDLGLGRPEALLQLRLELHGVDVQ